MDLQEAYLHLLPNPEIEPIVVMTEESFDNLITFIDTSSLALLFTITCFSSLICCTLRDKYYYKPIKQDDNTSKQISV